MTIGDEALLGLVEGGVEGRNQEGQQVGFPTHFCLGRVAGQRLAVGTGLESTVEKEGQDPVLHDVNPTANQFIPNRSG